MKKTSNNDRKKLHITSAQLIPVGFLGLILLGSLLLYLPVSTAEGYETDYLTALFTSVTSVCVTGLVVVDTYAHWSLFGKVIILLLIQVGGLGLVMVASMMLVAWGSKISLKARVLIMDSFNLDTVRGTVRFMCRVAAGVMLVEMTGAVLYSIRFVPQFGRARGWWYAVFHSVSAFCNAGIDILGPSSLINYHDDPLIMITTMLLIIAGGLGYIVWFDIADSIAMTIKNRKIRFIRHLREHTRLVLFCTAFLIISGAVIVGVTEWNNPDTFGNLSVSSKIMNSIFQSITFRTAGFAAVPQEKLTDATATAGCVYMFIGGSPMGMAGGVKTVTVAVLLINAFCYIGKRDEAVLWGRTLDREMIRKASAIFTISLAVTLFLSVLLMAVEHVDATDALYEIFSATATVGLTRALTPGLGTAGRVIVIIAMYLGRIGPISMAFFFSSGNVAKNEISYADGKFYVG